MGDARWTMYQAVLRQRRYESFAGPIIGGVLAIIGLGLLNWRSFQGLADPLAALSWSALMQVVASWATATFAMARFAKYRLTPEDWQLLSMTGSGPRLMRGIWGPPARDALLAFAFIAPMICFLAAMFGVSLGELFLLELNAASWLIVGLLLELFWSFIRLRGPLCNLISRQLRWVIPFLYLTIGSAMTGWMMGVLPASSMPTPTLLMLTAGSMVVAVAAFGCWYLFGELLLRVAGQRFGHLINGVNLKDIEIPKVFRGRTSRKSRPLKTSWPCFEREFRTTVFGIVGVLWITFLLIGLLGIGISVSAEYLLTLNAWYIPPRLESVRDMGSVIRWAAISLFGLAALVIPATVPTSRFDSESKQQTTTSLFLAVSAKRFVMNVMGVSMFVGLMFIATSVALASLSPMLDRSPTTMWIMVLLTLLGVILTGYLCLLGVTVRLRYTNWFAQIIFVVLAVLLGPIAIFVMPSLILKSCDELDGNPQKLEAGMSRKMRTAD